MVDCPGCGKPLPEDSPPHKKYHDSACKMRYYRRTKPEQYPKYRAKRRTPQTPPPARFIPKEEKQAEMPDDLLELTTKQIVILDLPSSVVVALLKKKLEHEEVDRAAKRRREQKTPEEVHALDPETARRVARILAKESHTPRTSDE